jgi:hypothetical protein
MAAMREAALLPESATAQQICIAKQSAIQNEIVALLIIIVIAQTLKVYGLGRP